MDAPESYPLVARVNTRSGVLWMRLTDLSLPIQLVLVGLLAVALALPVIRGSIFIYRQKMGVRTAYPKSWSAAQCRALEHFRVLIGLGLIPLWGSFILIAHWPFQFWDLFYFIVLLLISSAWIQLLDQRNWQKSSARLRSFWRTITFIASWWGVAFATTAWMLAPSLSALFLDRTGARSLSTSNSNSLLVGEAGYGDWRADGPGIRRYIKPSDLPAPYQSSSAANVVSVVAKPPDARLNVPLGFTVKPLASGLNQPRLIRVAPNGDIFIAESGAGQIRVLRLADGGDEVIWNEVFAPGLQLPFGIAFYPSGNDPQWIYVANTDSVVRFHYRSGDLHAGGTPEMIVPSLPRGGHWTRDIVFSVDDSKMFVSVGSASNDAESSIAFNAASPRQLLAFLRQKINDVLAKPTDEMERADVLVFSPSGEGRRVYASGIRNCVGTAVNPITGDLWCSTNERDGLGDDLPPDYITRVREGGFYGWPWYYIGPHEDPLHVGARPDLKSKVILPDILIQPHSASLQMMFYSGAQFPAEYTGNVFAAEHGSWNRGRPTGYKIIRALVKDGVPSGEYEDFVTGFVLNDEQVWGRPVGVAQARDGSLLFSDDGNNTLWRVSYTNNASQSSVAPSVGEVAHHGH
jgi:glucose/arabinose dehydrogenase